MPKEGISLRGSIRSCGYDRRLDCRSQKISKLARWFYKKIGRFSVDLLDLQLKKLCSTRQQEIFGGRREQIFASWCLITKITKISASRKFPSIWYNKYTRKCRTLWGRAWASWCRNIMSLMSDVTHQGIVYRARPILSLAGSWGKSKRMSSRCN